MTDDFSQYLDGFERAGALPLDELESHLYLRSAINHKANAENENRAKLT